MPEQWPRVLLRAALREVGYDAIGTRGLPGAGRQRAVEPGRGAVALVVVDQDAVAGRDRDLRDLVTALGDPPAVLLAHVTRQPPAGAWARVIARPVSVQELVAAVQSLVPLPITARKPLDQPVPRSPA